MKKIEPVAWALRENCGICFDKAIAYKWDDNPVPLWTDKALQTVAEAVQQACAVACIENDGAVPQVDLAAIINQLKGR